MTNQKDVDAMIEAARLIAESRGGIPIQRGRKEVQAIVNKTIDEVSEMTGDKDIGTIFGSLVATQVQWFMLSSVSAFEFANNKVAMDMLDHLNEESTVLNYHLIKALGLLVIKHDEKLAESVTEYVVQAIIKAEKTFKDSFAETAAEAVNIVGILKKAHAEGAKH